MLVSGVFRVTVFAVFWTTSWKDLAQITGELCRYLLHSVERLQELFIPLSVDPCNASKWDCMCFSCLSLVQVYELEDESLWACEWWEGFRDWGCLPM